MFKVLDCNDNECYLYVFYEKGYKKNVIKNVY